MRGHDVFAVLVKVSEEKEEEHVGIARLSCYFVVVRRRLAGDSLMPARPSFRKVIGLIHAAWVSRGAK